MMVVVAREADEPQIFVAQQRRVIENLQHAAHLALRQVAATRVSNHQPDLALPAERHTHASARQRAVRTGRGQIVEQARQRHVDGDFEDRRVGHVFPVQTEA
jgi:hypothetical protein